MTNSCNKLASWFASAPVTPEPTAASNTIRLADLWLNKETTDQLIKARKLASTLGVRVAALYLKNRGWKVEAAIVALSGIKRNNRRT